MPETMTRPTRTEEFRITGEELLAKARELVREGNVRRIIIKNEDELDHRRVPAGDRRDRCGAPAGLGRDRGDRRAGDPLLDRRRAH